MDESVGKGICKVKHKKWHWKMQGIKKKTIKAQSSYEVKENLSICKIVNGCKRINKTLVLSINQEILH